MRDLLPHVPSGRSVVAQGTWESSWVPELYLFDTQRLGPFGPLASLLGNMLGAAVILVLFAFPLALRVGARWMPLQRARWDASTLHLEGPVEHTWSWSEIDAFGLDGQGRFQFLVHGREHTVPTPTDPDDRDALLARWAACLSGGPARPPLDAPRWSANLEEQTTWVRFHARPARPGFRPSALRSTLYGLWLWAALMGAVVVVASLARVPTAVGLLAVLGSIVAGFLPIGLGIATLAEVAKRGAVTIDQHTLTLDPVVSPAREIPWDAIQGIEHDDLGLRITTDVGTFAYDFASEPPSRVRGLLGEVEERWKARVRAGAPEADLDAIARLRQLARPATQR